MGNQDDFQARLRAMVDDFSRSVERFSEVDLEALAERYGVDAERARGLADAAGQWLSGRLAADLPDPHRPHATHGSAESRPPAGHWHTPTRPGPHPLDFPSDAQGLALSALDSGRWTVRPGSYELSDTEVGPPPPPEAPDLVSELRARDWITNDGTVTLVGRHALTRWCRSAEDLAPARPDAPPA